MLLKQILEGLEGLTDEQRTAILAAAGGEEADVLTAEEQAAAADLLAQMEIDHKAAIKNMAIDSAIEGYLRDNGAKHPDLLATKFDRDALMLDADNKVTNVADIGGKIKDEYKDLFAATLAGTTPPNPDTSTTGGSYEALVKNADNMSVDEIAAQLSGMDF